MLIQVTFHTEGMPEISVDFHETHTDFCKDSQLVQQHHNCGMDLQSKSNTKASGGSQSKFMYEHTMYELTMKLERRKTG